MMGFAASCGAAATGLAAAGATCGTSRTAANVPVVVKIGHGSIACTTAMQIEQAYAAKLQSGQAPGNGGGGPITVNGWVCQGFPTPEVLRTGQASECRKDSTTEILAILPSPTVSATALPLRTLGGTEAAARRDVHA
jgi:hypothetical protein